MSDANQVRINELARELEVKAKAIIDLLAGYGVTEKKTHSSSIPVDVAEKVRKHIQGVADAEAAEEAKAKADKERGTLRLRPRGCVRPLHLRRLRLQQLCRETCSSRADAGGC